MALVSCEGKLIAGPNAQGIGQTMPPAPGAGPGSGTPPTKGTACSGTPTPEVQPLRRLAHEEYQYTIADAFNSAGVTAAVEAAVLKFPRDTISLGFRNNASFSTVRDSLMNNYVDAAEAISLEVVKDLKNTVPCSASGNESGCATEFAKSLGRKLYRRSLTDTEVAAYIGVYNKARMRPEDFKTGIQWMVFSFLISPQFLYRAENDEGLAGGTVRPLKPIEVAGRMASLIWRSAPDEALLVAAETGKLNTREDIKTAAARMLADAKSRRAVDFFEEWLDTDELPAMTRNPDFYPGLDAQLPSLLRQEVQEYVKQVLYKEDGKLATLLGGDFSVMNSALAKHYGNKDAPAMGWGKVKPVGERAGLFMLGGVVSNHDKDYRTSIVNRGFKLRTQIMCQVVPAPPANIPQLVTTGNVSQRERLAQHRQDPSCAGCHNLMDPLGQTFENLDAVGRMRSKDEGGNVVLVDGEIKGSRDSNGPVASGKDLMLRLSKSEEVKDCFAKQLYRFSHARQESVAPDDNPTAFIKDACSVSVVTKAFRDSDGNINDLILALTQTDDFLFREAASL
jgi:Protein of unknown function (DUF1592)/Protein of unknown function (DUF1588)/Protein of unknown function (DUF1595)/Protein of unknown function (DUF1587)/Protein of unknown function (DUF1585)